jgi:hypothetical protein
MFQIIHDRIPFNWKIWAVLTDSTNLAAIEMINTVRKKEINTF